MNRRFPLFGGNDNSYVILSDNILSGFSFSTCKEIPTLVAMRTKH